MHSALIDALALQHIDFEGRLILVSAMFIAAAVLLPITAHYWVRIFRKYIKRHPEADHVFRGHESLRRVFHDLSFVIKIILLLYAGFIGWQTVHEQPVLAYSSPVAYSKIADASPEIRLTFSVPVDKDNITFHVSPIVEGEWMWEKPVLNSFYRTVRFLPTESFLPDSRIVVYVVGLRSVLQKNTSHELAIEFTAPRTPQLSEVFPHDGQGDVPASTSLLLTYDQPVGDFVETQVVIDPQHSDFQIEDQGNMQTIWFQNPLRQDQTYTVHVYQTIRSYDTKTKEDRVRGETRHISTFTFTTVSTPLIADYTPKGSSVLPHTPLHVSFDQPMDQESVRAGLEITPPTQGELVWVDESTFTFTPTDGWQRATDYVVRLQNGLKSASGGIITDTVELRFATIGAVKVTNISPFNGSSGVDPQSANVSITFDQPVDQQSAQSAVSVSPSVEYTATWQGNTLMLGTAGRLGHNTRYTIKVANGIKGIYGLDSTQTFESSFTTKPKSFVLGIPYYRQEETFTCNIAAMRMALAYRGVHLSEDVIQDGVGYSDNPNSGWVDGYGVHIGPVAGFVDNYRSVVIKQGWNVVDMLKEVQKGNPVIVWEYNRYSEPHGAFTLPSGATGYMGMHSEVIRGFIGEIDNPTHILTNDPWRGQLTYTVDTFKSIWGYMNNTALVVY